jgi:hypothetical protein
MDFIERTLGIAPDGGNGLLELTIFLAAMLLLVVTWIRRSPSAHLLTRRRIAKR